MSHKKGLKYDAKFVLTSHTFRRQVEKEWAALPARRSKLNTKPVEVLGLKMLRVHNPQTVESNQNIYKVTCRKFAKRPPFYIKALSLVSRQEFTFDINLFLSGSIFYLPFCRLFCILISTVAGKLNFEKAYLLQWKLDYSLRNLYL